MKKIFLLAALVLLKGPGACAQSRTVTVRWALPVPNLARITAIHVMRSQNANLSGAIMVCNVPANATSCVDRMVRPNQTFWYYAISIGTQANSVNSNVSKITVHP